MSVRISSALSASALLFGLSLLPSTAHAALDKCGGVYLTANSQCEFKPVQQCMTTCAAPAVEQTCAAQTYTMCSGMCTMTETKSCTTTRSDSCSMTCDSTKTESSDQICVSDCSDDCTTKCASADNMDDCEASCTHCCNRQCEDHCQMDDQATDCTTKCSSAVDGECTADVTRDCLVDCQTTNFVDCQTTTVQQCNTTCQDKGGAIFCDGQYLNADNLQDCADQLAAEFSFNINVTATATATVTTASNDTKKSTKCSFGPAPRHANGMIFGALAAVALAVTRRRRRA